MKWLNIDITILRSPDFIGVDPVARATWLCLLGYCVDQENGGTIADCEQWGDRRWMQTCAVTRAEIDASKPLAWWADSALVIAHYPIDKEMEVKAKRESGKKGGRPKAITNNKPCGLASDNHMVQKTENGKEGEGERKGKECKEKDIIIVPAIAEPKAKTFKQWTREEFKAECIAKSEQILEEVDGVAFYQYWIEPNTKGKMRFQLNQTWDTALRMHTWRRNKEAKEARKAF
jgi:hypothetical protein